MDIFKKIEDLIQKIKSEKAHLGIYESDKKRAKEKLAALKEGKTRVNDTAIIFENPHQITSYEIEIERLTEVISENESMINSHKELLSELAGLMKHSNVYYSIGSYKIKKVGDKFHIDEGYGDEPL